MCRGNVLTRTCRRLYDSSSLAATPKCPTNRNCHINHIIIQIFITSKHRSVLIISWFSSSSSSNNWLLVARRLFTRLLRVRLLQDIELIIRTYFVRLLAVNEYSSIVFLSLNSQLLLIYISVVVVLVKLLFSFFLSLFHATIYGE